MKLKLELWKLDLKVKHDKKEKSNLKIKLQLHKVNLKVRQLGGGIGIEVINRIYNERFF